MLQESSDFDRRKKKVDLELEMLRFIENEKKIESNNHFITVVAPYTARPNSDYVVALTLHVSDEVLTKSCVMNVIVQDAEDENRYYVERQIELTVNVTELLNIRMRDDIPLNRNYKLVVETVSETYFRIHVEKEIIISTKNCVIMIQTDRAIYKPGDCVQFRVLVLDYKLRPAVIGENGFDIMIIVSIGYLENFIVMNLPLNYFYFI